jgi:glucose-1-phosphatase
VSANSGIDVIVCDLGGVLIELVGVETMLAWCPQLATTEALWRRWLRSPAVRRYETGGATTAEFADELIAEFELPVDAPTFLAAFALWPRRPYPGAFELLARLKPRYRLASASNTNALHWERFARDWSLPDRFDDNFPSYQVGKLKPDGDYFLHIVERVDADPARVLFVDDNAINVEGARATGLNAHVVRGPDDLLEKLVALGVLDREEP